MNRRERREKKKEINILKELVIIIKQYFPELINKFEGLTDIRSQSYVKYQMKVIFIVRLMALICEIKSMHGLTREFNTQEIEEIIKYMINKMIRNKMLEKYKIRGKYNHIVIGTGLATSKKRYNENCLVKNKTDKNGNEYKEYSTYVLEAKLVVGEMVFSIGREFVENESENVSKQDCEINAFKRLSEKIKGTYPRLKIIMNSRQ